MHSRTRVWRALFYVAFLTSAVALLARPAYPDKPRWGIWLALAFWGVATEIAQRSVSGRTADVLDFAADAVGAAIVLVLPPSIDHE